MKSMPLKGFPCWIIIVHVVFFLIKQSVAYNPLFPRAWRANKFYATPSMSTITEASPTSIRLPVTILSGFLGSGKTTLLNHILQSEHHGRRYAVIVNDMSELNIDAKLVDTHIQKQEERLVEMSNGCICCTLREDLLKEVASLAKQGKFDHLIIESTGVSEPLPVAETFTFKTEEGGSESLLDLAEIDSMVTVIDAVNFAQNMQDAEDLSTRNLQVKEDDERTITDLLVSQVEFASVIIVNKCDMVDDAAIRKVTQLVRSINSDAKILQSVMCAIDIGEVIGSRSYDFDKVSSSPSWLHAINDDSQKIPETEEYGITSFVYRAKKPFHPQRLWDFINTEMSISIDDDDDDDDDDGGDTDDGNMGGAVEKAGSEDVSTPSKPVILNFSEASQDNAVPEKDSVILRSKGFFWLATRPEENLVWSQAGGLFQITPGGYWWADTPKEMWPTDEQDVAAIMGSHWDEVQGDRRQELVFIGTGMERDSLTERLDLCLLSEKELQSPETWSLLEDPFPTYEFVDDEDEDHDHNHNHDHDH